MFRILLISSFAITLLTLPIQSIANEQRSVTEVRAIYDILSQKTNTFVAEYVKNNNEKIDKVTIMLTIQPSGKLTDVKIINLSPDSKRFSNELVEYVESLNVSSANNDPTIISILFDFKK
jgi:undecaprenyl pyrophosphate synthase